MSNPYGYSNSNNQGGGEAASYYASANQSQQQSYNKNNGQQQQQQQRQDGPTGERGVLGAIGGAVAGGVGGHQLGGKATGHSKTSAILGAIAGAVAGHKIQDGVEDWKDNRDEEKKKKEEEEKRKQEEAEQKERDEENKKKSEEQRKKDEEKRRKEEDERRKNHQGAQQQQQQSRDSGVRYAGGFSGSCKDISLDQAGGEYVLRASCRGKDGSYRSSSIALNGILSNDKGCFRWAAPGGSCAPPPPSNNCGGGQYTVVAGDSLHAIGERYKVDWRELARHNNIANPDLIFPGQVLNIPGRGGNNNNNNASNNSGGGNFGASARNVRLEDCGKKLVAELRRDGQYVQASIILDERIGNENGCLVYKN